jgi:hypothetical protein
VYGGTVLHVPLCGVFCLVFADELSLHMLVSEGKRALEHARYVCFLQGEKHEWHLKWAW